MNIDISVSVIIGLEEFTFFRKPEGLLSVVDAKTNLTLTEYNISSGFSFFDVERTARGIAASIIDKIVQPHMILEEDSELLNFFLTVVNVVNMFVQNEFVFKDQNK